MEVEEKNVMVNIEPTQIDAFKQKQTLFQSALTESICIEDNYGHLLSIGSNDGNRISQNMTDKQAGQKFRGLSQYGLTSTIDSKLSKENEFESKIRSNLKAMATLPVKQWVFSIERAARKSSEKSAFGVGFFDGSFAMYSAENQFIGQTNKLTKEPVKCLKFLNKYSNAKAGSNVIIMNSSSNKIQISRVSKVATEKKFSVSQLALCEGHSDSIESIDLHPESDSRFCSGGTDQCLGIWRLKDKQFDSVFNNMSTKVHENPLKRVKLCTAKITPEWLKPIHDQPLTKTVWAKDQMIYSSSIEGAIKIFDPYSLKEAASFTTKVKPPTAMCYNSNLLTVGSEDGIIAVFDERINHQISLPILQAHVKPISDLKFHPTDPNIFISVSHDSHIKIWDLRTFTPSTTIGDVKRKTFVVEWNGDKEFLVGGSDSQITAYKYDQD